MPDSLPVCRSSSLQEKGKVTFEEFSLDAERRAHGMRLFSSTYSSYSSYKTCFVLLENLALLLVNVLGKHTFAKLFCLMLFFISFHIFFSFLRIFVRLFVRTTFSIIQLYREVVM